MLGFWARALTRSTLDLTLTTNHGLVTRIVERPGAVLDDDDLDALVGKMRKVASKTLAAGDLTYGVFSGDRHRLSRTIVTLVSDKATGEPIAFNALAIMDTVIDGEPTPVIHLGLVMVDRDQRGHGLSGLLYGLTTLVLFVRGGLRPRWVSNVTQVPAVIGMVSETFSEVVPTPSGGSRQSFAHLSLARQIMRDHRQVFGVGDDARYDESRCVIENSYTGGSDDLRKTFDEVAKHRDPKYDAFCRELLDYDRGDDVLQLGKIDLPAARRYLVGHAPRASLPGLAGAAVFLTLQRLVLPFVHWLDTGRPYGRLRPRNVKVS